MSRGLKMEEQKQKKHIRFKKTLNLENATRWIEICELLSFRRRGLPLFVQKKHGFEGEIELNTDGFCKLIDFQFNYYLQTEKERIAKQQRLKEKFMSLENQLKNLKLDKTLQSYLKNLNDEIEG